MEKEKANPFWLPQGSVRAMIVFSLLGIMAYMLVKQVPMPEWLIAIISSAMAYYFTMRKV